MPLGAGDMGPLGVQTLLMDIQGVSTIFALTYNAARNNHAHRYCIMQEISLWDK